MSTVSPIKLQPSFKDYLWGGTKLKTMYGKQSDFDIVAESWELSAHKDGQSTVVGGEFDGLCLVDYLDRVGKDVLGTRAARFDYFPLLIKFIDAKGDLSVQVHPDDDYALKNEGEYGKTEMWYILDAKEGAGIYYGVKKDCTKEELQNAIEQNKIEDVLRFVPCKKGESYFIPAGTIHAIGAGLLIAEVQQNSNVTYRVYDYNRVGADGKPRELHTEKALTVSNLTPMKDEKEKNKEIIPSGTKTLLSSCSYFEAVKLNIDGQYKLIPNDSFVCVFIIEGSGEIDGMPFNKFDTFFVPADHGETLLKGNFSAMISYCP